MNATTRTALRLLVATPLAAGAIAFGGGVAHADGGFDPNGPIVIAQPDDGGHDGPGDIAVPEPKPQPDPAPKPQGPGDIANPDGGDDPKPHGPGDIANPHGGDDPKPHGPGDIANPENGDDPKPQGPDDLAIPEPQDKPGDKGDKPAKGGKDKGGKDKDVEVANSGDVDQVASEDVPVPNRIDAGAGSVADDEQGLSLAWVLAGGGVVTAAGSVLARQRLARRIR